MSMVPNLDWHPKPSDADFDMISKTISASTQFGTYAVEALGGGVFRPLLRRGDEVTLLPCAGRSRYAAYRAVRKDYIANCTG